MMQRRVFLGTTAAAMAGTLPCAQAATAQSDAGMALPSKLHLLVDPRQARSVADATAAAGTGPRRVVHELPQRLDPHWARALFATLRSEGAALRGTTRAADHFVLRQLAFDLGWLPVAQTPVAGARVALVQWTLAPREAGDRRA